MTPYIPFISPIDNGYEIIRLFKNETGLLIRKTITNKKHTIVFDKTFTLILPVSVIDFNQDGLQDIRLSNKQKQFINNSLELF